MRAVSLHSLDAMRVVVEYRNHAKQCRDLAARASNPAEKRRLKYRAASWAKMAAVRERDLNDAAETAPHE
jgi:hypothetical protein